MMKNKRQRWRPQKREINELSKMEEIPIWDNCEIEGRKYKQKPQKDNSIKPTIKQMKLNEISINQELKKLNFY